MYKTILGFQLHYQKFKLTIFNEIFRNVNFPVLNDLSNFHVDEP